MNDCKDEVSQSVSIYMKQMALHLKGHEVAQIIDQALHGGNICIKIADWCMSSAATEFSTSASMAPLPSCCSAMYIYSKSGFTWNFLSRA
ncbi:hypothetical protein ACFX13_032454 [Malus domestica]